MEGRCKSARADHDRPETRDIVQNEYMRRIEKVNGKLANVEFETMPMVKDPWKKINKQK